MAKLLDFLMGLKRQPYKQAIGALFYVDEENDEIYACALGQGCLTSGLITEEEIKARVTNDRTVAEIKDFNGVINEKRVKIMSGEFNSLMDNRIAELFSDVDLGIDFTGWVVSENDDEKKSVTEIGVESRSLFKELWDKAQEAIA